MPNKSLTPKQEAFARAVALGESKAGAYRRIYRPAGNPLLHRISALKISARPHVAARIRELQQTETEGLFLDRSRKREILRAFAENTDLRPLERMRAIDLDNQMTNEYQQNVRVEGEVTLGVILEALRPTMDLPTHVERDALGLDLESVAGVHHSVPNMKATPVRRNAKMLGPLEDEEMPLRGPLADDIDEMVALVPKEDASAFKADSRPLTHGTRRRYYDE